jgi:hypothetical protein
MIIVFKFRYHNNWPGKDNARQQDKKAVLGISHDHGLNPS